MLIPFSLSFDPISIAPRRGLTRSLPLFICGNGDDGEERCFVLKSGRGATCSSVFRHIIDGDVMQSRQIRPVRRAIRDSNHNNKKTKHEKNLIPFGAFNSLSILPAVFHCARERTLRHLTIRSVSLIVSIFWTTRAHRSLATCGPTLLLLGGL